MLKLDRRTLSQLLQGNQQAIITFERVLKDVGGTLPDAIDEANALAGAALAVAQANTALLSMLTGALDRLDAAPTPVPHVDPDDATPRAHLGTISAQNHDSVDITGGTAGLDAGAVSAPPLYFGGDRTSGLYRSAANVLAVTISGTQRAYFDANTLGVWGSLTASQQVIANAPAGTPPLAVVSTTRVANLNVDRAGLADAATSADYAVSAGHATSADNLGPPGAYPGAATDLATVITLANALRTAAIAKGL